MARAYCTLEDVRRLLRTANKKIKFSEAYQELGYNSGNTGTVRLSDVSFVDSYAGHERYTLTFSDSTSFEVNGEESGYLGIGGRGSTFTCNHFSIAPSFWSGTPDADDSVFFISDSNVSVDDAEAFIGDASDYIRNRLGEVFGDSTNIPWEADLTIQIPSGIKFAATRLAAYYIYTACLAGTIFDQQAPVEVAWHEEAEKALDAFINWYEKESQVGSPRWRSRDTLFNKLGINGIEEGEIDLDADVTDDEGFTRN